MDALEFSTHGQPIVNPTTQTLTDSVHERLRGMIIRCQLTPGAHVTEQTLTTLVESGKAPVRAALVRLSEEGWLRAIPRHGYQISPLTLKDAQNILDMRLLLEPHAASLAAGRLDEQSLALFAKSTQLFKKDDAASIDAYFEVHRAAKLAIAEVSGNLRLVSAIAKLLDEFERYSRLSIRLIDREEQMRESGRRYLDALRGGDAEEAGEQSRKQLQETGAAVVAALTGRAAELSQSMHL